VTAAHAAPAVAVCALLAVAAVLLLREGHRGRARPGHGRLRPHSRDVGTAQQDHNAIEGDPTVTTPLWEIDHPYYASEGNYYKNGLHNQFASWAEFTETTFYDGDRDLNLLYRWDWDRPDPADYKDELEQGEELPPETLKLFFILQRKAIACSAEMPITEADEPAVRAWLTECAARMRLLWEPLLPATEEPTR
jgi:hypothetical protein